MRLVALILAVVVLPSLASAQQGILVLSSDQVELNLVVDDHSWGTTSVYVMHLGTVGSTAAAFSYLEYPGVTMARAGDGPAPGMVAVGDIDTGIEVAYNECKAGFFPIYRIDYQTYGTSAPCSYLQVGPHPTYVAVRFIDCVGGITDQPMLAVAVVNPDQTCNPGPTASSTWGRVKALYR